MGWDVRTRVEFSTRRRRMVTAGAVALALALAPRMAAAEGLFDFLFSGAPQKQRQTAAPGQGPTPAQGSFFADPFGLNQPAPTPPRPVASGSGPAFCVRTCDGRYFPLQARGGAPADVPGVLPGHSDAGVRRQFDRRRGDQQWRTLCRQ